MKSNYVVNICIKNNDAVHEIARDEARHGKAFKGLLDRYFGK